MAKVHYQINLQLHCGCDDWNVYGLCSFISSSNDDCLSVLCEIEFVSFGSLSTRCCRGIGGQSDTNDALMRCLSLFSLCASILLSIVVGV